jgi:ABC-type multidrug transport system ATPase subunit
MIDIPELWHHYGIKPVLRGVSLHIERGEVVCVMGPNGMGKSTLLSVVAGVLSPMKGSVQIDGRRRRASVEDEQAIRRQVVYLPDTPWLSEGNTGREFLFAVGRLYEVAEERLFDHIERLLDLFDLTGLADNPIRGYSSGQKKKLGICSALLPEAPVMILDEPFSGGLDSSALLALPQVLRHRTKEQGATILMAVPVPELVEGLADRIAVIKDGQILAFDTPDGLRQRSGAGGSLAQVLETIIHPQGVTNIRRYFQERPS